MLTHRQAFPTPRGDGKSDPPGGRGGCPPGDINAGGAPATPAGGVAMGDSLCRLVLRTIQCDFNRGSIGVERGLGGPQLVLGGAGWSKRPGNVAAGMTHGTPGRFWSKIAPPYFVTGLIL